uniref:Uncharacterized protein n=1 Tax=uncultured Flavobacteriia bacterium TaxID=212695 RepID=H6RDT6_9BACT|nr:hypothetical protein VIS_S3ASA20018 [uncultured Flavobacteriia bacterium]
MNECNKDYKTEQTKKRKYQKIKNFFASKYFIVKLYLINAVKVP